MGLGCPPLSQTKGVCFLNSKGCPMSTSSFYKHVANKLRVICGNPDLNITVSVLRHLCSDFVETFPEQEKGSLSLLAGHTHATALGHYVSPGLKSQGKSASLSRAAKAFTTAQNELLLRAEEAEKHDLEHPGELGDPPQSPSSTTKSGATVSAALSEEEVECLSPDPEPNPKRPCLEMVPVGKPGKPQKHFKSTSSSYISVPEFFNLSLHGRWAAFLAMYKHTTNSQNAEWLFFKLTGQPKASYQGYKKQVFSGSAQV